MKIVKIKINDMGKVEIEASGFLNATCLDSLKEVEKILGKLENVKLKPEGRIKNNVEKETQKA